MSSRHVLTQPQFTDEGLWVETQELAVAIVL